MVPIGAQVPMAGGVLCALDYAVSVGCETFQIFSKSPRRWVGPPTDQRLATDFRAACRTQGIERVFTHASYLINMGAEADELWQRSTIALADELTRGFDLGATGVVVHLGRRFSDEDADCVDRVTRCIAAAVAMTGDEHAPILLENSAGAGRQFGVSVAEMADALVSVRAAGIDAGLCFDTCHGFAGGIDVRSDAAWSRMLAYLDERTGPHSIRLVHANDCKGEFGSHKDRHEWIGDGFLGTRGFAAMFGQAALDRAAVVVEMPGDGPHKDEENIRRLKALRDGGGEPGARDPALD